MHSTTRALLRAFMTPGDPRAGAALAAWRGAGCPDRPSATGRPCTPHGEVPTWLVPYRDRLGQVPDSAIAEAAGRSVGAVIHWRRRLGIASRRCSVSRPAASPVREGRHRQAATWPPELLSRLGHEVDGAIARDYGLSRQRVQQLRIQHGIPISIEVMAAADKAQRERTASQRRPLPDEARAWFGQVSHAEIARRLRCSTAMVARWRVRYALPVPPPYNLHRSKLDVVRDLFGVLLDAEIARQAGVTYAAIVVYRRVHPDLPRSPRSKRRTKAPDESDFADSDPLPERA